MKSKYYVGQKEPIDGKDIEKDSIWQVMDNVFYLRVIDPETLKASTLEWNASRNRYETKTFEVVLTKLDEHFFLNLKKENEELYIILRMSASPQGMALFTVKDKKIEKDMKEGKLKALKKGKYDFILQLTKEELDNYVRQNMNELFDYDSPGIIKPLKGFKAK
jgi:hypothetical protein